MIKASGTVGTVRKLKGNQVWHVPPDQAIYESIQGMADEGVGALLVFSREKLVDVVS